MTVAYPLDETRLRFIEKSQTVYDFGLETDRHPPSIHLFGDKWLIQSVLFQTSKTRRNDNIIRRQALNFNGR
jgi:hypothetical protein